MFGALYYTMRLATRNPDVTWNRETNPEPWEAYRNKQYKVRNSSKIENKCRKFSMLKAKVHRRS